MSVISRVVLSTRREDEETETPARYKPPAASALIIEQMWPKKLCVSLFPLFYQVTDRLRHGDWMASCRCLWDTAWGWCCWRFGKMSSGFRPVTLGCKDQKLRHVQSLRRQVFMFLNSTTQTLDVSFQVKHEDRFYMVDASSGNIKCLNVGRWVTSGSPVPAVSTQRGPLWLL